MSASGERVVPTAVFIVTFFAMAVLLIAGFNEMLTRAEQTKGGTPPGSSESLLAGDMMLDLFDPVAQEADGTLLDDDNRYQFLDSFQKTGQTDVGCMIARNWSENFFTDFDWTEYGEVSSDAAPGTCIHRSSHHDNPDFKPSDFLLFWQTWMGGTLALERRYRYAIIPFADLSTAHDAYLASVGTNFTIIQMHLRYWVTGLVQWTRDADFYMLDTQLWANKFNVSVATGFNATYGSISVSTVIGQLIGLRLPGVPMWIQAMIMIPVAVAVLLILVMIVTYFIP
jgi:hypothetical protein